MGKNKDKGPTRKQLAEAIMILSEPKPGETALARKNRVREVLGRLTIAQ